MQHDWFMYHLRSTYKNRLDFPFKFTNLWKNITWIMTMSTAAWTQSEREITNNL